MRLHHRDVTCELDGLTNRLIAYRFVRNLMSAQDLKDALRDIPESQDLTLNYAPNGNQLIHIGERTIEIGPMAGNDEVRAKLNIQKINEITSPPMSTIGEQLKAARAKLAEARDGAARAVADCADASAVVLQEADKASKEAAALRAEVAELTNGAPA